MSQLGQIQVFDLWIQFLSVISCLGIELQNALEIFLQFLGEYK